MVYDRTQIDIARSVSIKAACRCTERLHIIQMFRLRSSPIKAVYPCKQRSSVNTVSLGAVYQWKQCKQCINVNSSSGVSMKAVIEVKQSLYQWKQCKQCMNDNGSSSVSTKSVYQGKQSFSLAVYHCKQCVSVNTVLV